MTPVGLKPPPLSPQKSRVALAGIAATVGLVLLLFPLAALMREPSFVPRMTIINTTPYGMHVEVAGSATDGWLGIGTFPRERDKSVEEIIDQGGTWIFRFSSAGIVAGELELDRADLARDGWRVTVPPGLAAPLEAAGVAPSAS